MSSRSMLSSRVKEFQSATDKYHMGELSISQISKLFDDLVIYAKEFIENKNEEHINLVLDSIHTFLKCVIDYGGVGSASLKVTHLVVLCSKISRALDNLQIEFNFLENLSIPIFEILVEPELQTWIAREILRMYCVTVRLVDRSVRTSIAKDKFSYHMGRLMDLLPSGDYDFQGVIVELLLRVYTKEELLQMENIFFFKTEEQKKAFYNIDTRKFDLSVRLYLNIVNDAERNVISVLCHKVYFDEFQLHEPDELSSFEGLWIDFNIRVGTISFYIDNRDYCDVTIKNDATWEIVTIFSENISNAEISIDYNKEKTCKEAIGKLMLKTTCSLFTAFSRKLSNCRTLSLYSTNVERMKEIFHRDIPKMTRKIKTKRIYNPMNRRGYKQLDIISIKSSTTSPNSTINHSFRTDIIRNELEHIRSTDGKQVSVTPRSRIVSERSFEVDGDIVSNVEMCDYLLDIKESSEKSSSIDQIIKSAKPERYGMEKNIKRQKNVKTYAYEDSFMSQLMEIETVADTQKIKNDKNRKASGYGKKFLSHLLDLQHDKEDCTETFVDPLIIESSTPDDMEHQKNVKASVCVDSIKHIETVTKTRKIRNDRKQKSFGYGGGKFLSRLMDIQEDLNRSASNGKALEPNLENKKTQSQSYGLNCQLINAEPDSTTLDGNQGFRDSELLNQDATSERSAMLSPLRPYIPTAEKISSSKKRKSAKNLSNDQNVPTTKTEISLTQNNAPDLHVFKNENFISINAIDKSKSKNLKKFSVSVTHCSPELFSSQVEIDNNDENVPPNSLSVNKTHFIKSDVPKVGVSISRLVNLVESPDHIRDCLRDPFEELKLEIPNRQIELNEDPKVNTTVEAPSFIKIEGPELGKILSENTEFFETARMDLDNVEIPDSQISVGKSLELLNDISQENHLSMSIRSRDQNSDSHSRLDRSRIKILTNIKIQSSVDKAPSVSNIPTWKKIEDQDNDVEHQEREIEGKIIKKSVKIKNSESIKTSSNKKFNKTNDNERHNIDKYTDVNDDKTEKNIILSISPKSPKSNKQYTYKERSNKNDQGINDSPKKPMKSLICNKIGKVPYIKLKRLSKSRSAEKTFDSEDDLPLAVLKKQLIESMNIKKSEGSSNALTDSNLVQDTRHEEREKLLVHNEISDKPEKEIIEYNQFFSERTQEENIHALESAYPQSEGRTDNLLIELHSSEETVTNLRKKPKLSPSASIQLKSSEQLQLIKIPNINGSENDNGIQIPNEQTKCKQQNGKVTNEEEKITNETSCEQYDLYDEIEQSMSLLFGINSIEHRNEASDNNLTIQNLRHQNDNEKNTSIIMSNTVDKMKRGKLLYDPDNHEETLRNFPEFMEISKENEINNTSTLNSITFSKQHIVNKPEAAKKMEKGPNALTKTKNKKHNEKRSIKNKELIESNNRKSISKMTSNNEQTKYKGSMHTKSYKRLNILFDEVLEKLKSRNYSTRPVSSVSRLKKDNKIEDKKYELDFSLVRSNVQVMENKHISGMKDNGGKKESLSEFTDKNRCGRNNSKGEENIDIDNEENDRCLLDFLRATGKLCAKFSSGQLEKPNITMKKKLIAVSHLLQDF